MINACSIRPGAPVHTPDEGYHRRTDAVTLQRSTMRSPTAYTLPLVALVTLILFTGTAGAVEHQAGPGIPNGRGVYTGCYATSTGDLRVIAGSKGCRTGERRVTWNRRGQAGPAGPQGEQGTQGAQGAVGPTGARGSTGSQGPGGPQGAAGAAGAQGPAGADGATGPIGPQGPAGADGATGPQGAIGPPGPAGADGATGPQGAVGSQGPPGAAGATGPAGPAGPAGATGATGAAGPAGPAGSQLVTGTPATSAVNAAQNTLVTATAACPAGKVVLGGGAHITTTATQKSRALLVSSYASNATTWTAIGVVGTGALGSGNTMTVTAYALCSA